MNKVSQRAPLAERFWAKVNKTETCWLWTAAIARARKKPGYYENITPRIGNDGKVFSAYRVSWELHYGKIPDELQVLHNCDNRYCVNPAHLFLGTQADNIRDCINKGRNNIGERNGKNKLKARQVIEIVERYRAGGRPEEIAPDYGIHPMYVPALARGRYWKHLGLCR